MDQDVRKRKYAGNKTFRYASKAEERKMVSYTFGIPIKFPGSMEKASKNKQSKYGGSQASIYFVMHAPIVYGF